MTTTTVKSNRGAKPNPNSKYSQSRALISALPVKERTRKNVLPKLMADIGMSDKVASVYFYNSMKELRATTESVEVTE